MTPEDLHRETAVYFVADGHDQPEIGIDPPSGRVGAVWAFLRTRAAGVRLSDVWDPVEERVIAGDSEPDPGARVDAGRAVGLVAAFEGIVHGGTLLPDISMIGSPLTIFWDAGPAWDDAHRVAAFFDLLGDLERTCAVRICFAATDGENRVGPQFAQIYARWQSAGARSVGS